MVHSCSRLLYRAALQRSFALVARVGAEHQTQQGQAHRADGTHCRYHREDDRR
jgi:hypothetical protein